MSIQHKIEILPLLVAVKEQKPDLSVRASQQTAFPPEILVSYHTKYYALM